MDDQPIFFEDFVSLITSNGIKLARPNLMKILDELVRSFTLFFLLILAMLIYSVEIVYYDLYSGSSRWY